LHACAWPRPLLLGLLFCCCCVWVKGVLGGVGASHAGRSSCSCFDWDAHCSVFLGCCWLSFVESVCSHWCSRTRFSHLWVQGLHFPQTADCARWRGTTANCRALLLGAPHLAASAEGFLCIGRWPRGLVLLSWRVLMESNSRPPDPFFCIFAPSDLGSQAAK